MKILLVLLMSFTLSGCFLLRPAPTAEQLAAVEQQIEDLREYRERAIDAGAPEELVADIDETLFETQAALKEMREAEPTNWLDMILVAAGIATGTGLLGAKAVAATKWIRMGRHVVRGLDAFQKDIPGEQKEHLHNTLRAHMSQQDKDLVKEARG